MRILTLACIIAFVAAPAFAQQAAPPPLVAPAAGTDSPQRHMTVRERFALANTTHDGKLAPDQAKAGFPAMARLFDVIDRDHKGYITMDDIKAYYDARRARQAAATQPAAQPGTELSQPRP